MKQRHGVIERALQRIVFHRLVFNQSFEDPEMDRAALKIGSEHTVLTITSGGCNALTLLCEEPRRLIAVDSNPAQNHLLELKRAAIYSVTPEEFFELFGRQRPPGAVGTYRRRLRLLLSPEARAYWDCNVRSLACGVITQGRMGLFFRVFRAILRSRVGARNVRRFLELPDLDAQKRFYHDRIEKALWAPPARWICTFRPLVWLAGTHPVQAERVHAEGDLYQFIRSSAEAVATGLPVAGNYFLHQALAGEYLEPRSVPRYMLAENLERLRDLIERLQIVTAWLGPHLETRPPNSIDRYSLLDIFDWMDGQTVEQTRRAIVHSAAPAARLVYRSGMHAGMPAAIGGPPFEEEVDLSQRLHARDRTGFYGSFRVFHLNGRCENGDQHA
jgi:S-adenosylmethionine-diacylglycerol 3-amino-3-carboxypropyl transferase